MLAYLNNSAVKTALIETLRKIPQEKINASIIEYSEKSSSIIGALIKSDNHDEFKSQYGLPVWLAYIVDTVAMASQKDALQNSLLIFNAIEIGSLIENKVYEIIADFLDDNTDSIVNLSNSEDIKNMARKMAALQRRAFSGETIDNVVWRKIRKEAVSLANNYDESSLDGLCARCVEAAAWDAIKSRTAASETLNLWHRAMVAKNGYPWESKDDVRIKTRLDELYAEEKTQHPDGAFINVFDLLEKKSPEMAKEIKDKYKLDNIAANNALKRRVQRVVKAIGYQQGLISRKDLFANPTIAGMQISPDGKYMAWLQNDNGVMNIWSAPRNNNKNTRQITFDKKRGINGFFWSYLSGLLIYSQDRDGDENWRLFAADVKNGEIRELAPSETIGGVGVRVSVSALSRKRPEEIIINSNKCDARYPDLYCLNLINGNIEMVQQNDGFAGFFIDHDYKIRFASRPTSSGGADLLRKEGDEWKLWISLSMEDASLTGPSWFSADSKTVYFYDSRGRDKAALTSFDTETFGQTIIAENEFADIGGTINDSETYEPLVYSVTYERHKRYLLDDSLKADIEFLDNAEIGEWQTGSRTSDGTIWLISAGSDIRPAALYLYDRTQKKLEKLYDLKPQLNNVKLSRMQPAIIKSRDGLDMVSYITIPFEVDDGEELSSIVPVPMVLLVHGGPWTRDVFGYNSIHQWLANRGYAVLSVNFRASSGFGKSFLRAGDGEWGGKMDEDLEDAIKWAIDKNIADAEKIAIFGGSYGGFAVLSALTKYPETYACGIDIVGPSNLETLLASIPPYWEAEREMQRRAIGDSDTEEGRAFLRDRSPLHRAANIKSPILIAQGGNDPRVKQAESEQMVAALRKHNIPFQYALFPDEGHGFVREANRMRFNALAEEFLAKYLGGSYEKWSDLEYPANSMILQSV